MFPDNSKEAPIPVANTIGVFKNLSNIYNRNQTLKNLRKPDS